VDAVDAAGGLAPGADPDRVNLAAPVVDGSRLAIPLVGQAAPAELAPQLPAGSGAPGSGTVDGAPASPGTPVDLNTADAQQLDSLPGVGPSTAEAIIAHRDEHGPFRSVEELLDVRGIGEAKLDALRDLVTAGT
jgi:competence protein ComEA